MNNDLASIVATWPHDTLITSDGQPYMHRYYIGGNSQPTHNDVAIRIHQFVASDPGRNLHDHPWDFTTTILTGSYIEHTPTGTLERRAGDTVHHRAEDLHRVELTTTPTWTLFAHGRARRRWGFLTPDGWIHWSNYPNTGSWQ